MKKKRELHWTLWSYIKWRIWVGFQKDWCGERFGWFDPFISTAATSNWEQYRDYKKRKKQGKLYSFEKDI